MAHLYADEDIPRPLVEHLRQLGHDVLTAVEAGQGNQSVKDSNILSHAANLRRVVITHNRKDFKRLHALTASHMGIIHCTRDDANPRALAERIHSALEASGDLAGQL